MALPAPSPRHTVVVTGASSGIGEQLARCLAARGHGLTLVARRADRLQRLADELAVDRGVEVDVVPADLLDAGDRAALAERLAGGPRVLAGLCNNAGFGSYGRFHELDAEREHDMVALNVLALHELTAAAIRAMLPHAEGAILNVASIAAFQPLPGMATYAATKAFVQSFSEAVHAELAGTGLSVTTLSPGPSPTEFGERAGVSLGPRVAAVPASVGPAAIAEAGVRGMERGRRTVIPGAVPRASAFGGRLVPRTLLLPAALLATRAAGRRPPQD
jgi:short-subunit dehydrogenase